MTMKLIPTLLTLALLGPASLLGTPAIAATDHSAHAGAAGSGLKRSERAYTAPSVPLVRQDGRKLDFAKALDDGRPVLLNFLYTSCTAICPVTAQVFAEVRERLGAERARVHVVSVSIDPEHDTPSRLVSYAQRFGGDEAWSFVTGSLADVVNIQRSFDSYQGDKMNHVPVTFLRAAPGAPWVRLDGFASPRQIVAELQPMLRAAPPANAPAQPLASRKP